MILAYNCRLMRSYEEPFGWAKSRGYQVIERGHVGKRIEAQFLESDSGSHLEEGRVLWK